MTYSLKSNIKQGQDLINGQIEYKEAMEGLGVEVTNAQDALLVLVKQSLQNGDDVIKYFEAMFRSNKWNQDVLDLDLQQMKKERNGSKAPGTFTVNKSRAIKAYRKCLVNKYDFQNFSTWSEMLEYSKDEDLTVGCSAQWKELHKVLKKMDNLSNINDFHVELEALAVKANALVK